MSQDIDQEILALMDTLGWKLETFRVPADDPKAPLGRKFTNREGKVVGLGKTVREAAENALANEWDRRELEYARFTLAALAMMRESLKIARDLERGGGVRIERAKKLKEAARRMVELL